MTSTFPHEEPLVATIGFAAIADSLREGWQDFRARPTTGLFLVVLYPLIGLVLFRFVFDRTLLPLLFPVASGFALIGPLAAAGLYELSRRQEAGGELDGVSAFSVLSRGRLVPLAVVGTLLLAIYAVWIAAAYTIYEALFDRYLPRDILELARQVLLTERGWMLLAIGCGVGFLFALMALAIGAVSLPAIVDRALPASEAIELSVRALLHNPAVMLAWGLVVALALVVGSLPFFLGLLVVLPVFGHATWHLYRRLVPR